MRDGRIDWEEVARQQALPARRTPVTDPTASPSFLPANPEPKRVIRAYPMPAQVEPMTIDVPAPARSEQKLTTSHVDRAQGFLIASAPLSAIVALGALVIAVAAFQVPVFSTAAAVVFLTAMAAVWLVAWVWHNSASPDGVMLWTVLLHYRLLRHEQRARHRRMDEELRGYDNE